VASPVKKDSPQSKDQPQVDWRVALNLLHKYLPSHFPRFDSDGVEDTIKINLEALLYSEESETIIDIRPKGSPEEITHTYLILKAFAKNFSGDLDRPFWFANLPFIFEATTFVERYADRLLISQMREILRAFRINRETIKSYLKRSFVKELNTVYLDAKVDRFIDDIKSYARSSLVSGKSDLSFAEAERATGLSTTAIRNLANLSNIENADISIDNAKNMISYEPH